MPLLVASNTFPLYAKKIIINPSRLLPARVRASVTLSSAAHFKYCDPSCQEDGTMFDILLERRISSLSPPSVSIETLDAELG